jgi:CheY-like chemotaxis protein
MSRPRRHMMSNPKILLVDDDADYVEATKVVLEAKGYDVVAAHDGKEGFEKAKSELPQIILVDLMMNTINEGYDLVRSIRSDDRFKEVPLIMISAAHQTEAFKNANFAPDDVWFPIDTFMDKPIDFEVLLGHLDKLLNK